MNRRRTRLLQITQERMKLGISKAELSRRAGLNESTYRSIESGGFVPYVSQLAKMARAVDWRADPRRLLLEVGPSDPGQR
jgi:transcriptional regulator with XRE-family HTH domain